MKIDALEDFAGPGGWDLGASILGLHFHGVDYDGPACETARAAGFVREQADVTEHESPAWARGLGHVSSPSCTLFSMAGSGVGRLVIDALADGIRRILHREADPATVRAEVHAAIYPTALAEVEKANAKRKPEKRWPQEKVEAKAHLDAKIAALVLEPARRVVELDPEWLAMEQVPEVLPLWQVYAFELGEQDWSVWCGVINAADYGVPQTRRRTIFMGHRSRKVAPPAPTHAEHPQDADLFGDVLEKWVCMADALGWEDRPYYSITHDPTGGGSGAREAIKVRMAGAGLAAEKPPVYVNGNQPNVGRRSADEPAPTILFGHRFSDVRWVFDRPATTIVGSFKPEVVAAPGYRTETSRQDAPGSFSVSVSEAGVLQSFPDDYPWQGSKSKQYEQVGNAIPPRLAAHVLGALLGIPNYAERIAEFYARDEADA